MIYKRLRYSKKFSSDVWNLRLLTQVFVFNKNKDLSIAEDLKVSYKYFFFFFFKQFKKKMALRILARRPFVYRIDVLRRKLVRRKYKWSFITLRLVKFYYSLLSYKQFRKIARLAKKKDGLFENNYVLSLEGRLVNFLYRTSLVDTIFNALRLIKNGFVTLNWKVFTYPNQRCSLFDILSFLPFILYDIFFDFIFRLSMRLILHPPLRFMYVSFFFLFSFLFKAPFKQDIPNRKIIDLYRLTGYAILY